MGNPRPTDWQSVERKCHIRVRKAAHNSRTAVREVLKTDHFPLHWELVWLENTYFATFQTFSVMFFLCLGKCCIFATDNLAWCIHALCCNASMPQSMPRFLWVQLASECGWVGKEERHNEGVYLTLCSWRTETSQLSLSCHGLSNGRCLRVWLYHNQWSIVPIYKNR